MSDLSERVVVMGDLHGNVSVFDAIYKVYGDGVEYRSAGDEVDGPEVRQLLHRFVSVGVKTVRSNHVQYALGAMLESEVEPSGAERRRDMVDIWHSIHRGTLESYGLYGGPSPANAYRLRDKMTDLGHLALLSESPLYYESEDFVVLHGDVTAEPWEEQKTILEAEYARNMLGKYWGWSDEHIMPPQLGEGQSVVHTGNLVRSGLKKRLLSGHFHLDTKDLDIRSFNRGQHLLLAGGHDRGFGVVYESWSSKMRVIEAD